MDLFILPKPISKKPTYLEYNAPSCCCPFVTHEMRRGAPNRRSWIIDSECKRKKPKDEAEHGRNPAPACDLKRKLFVQGPQALAREAIGKRKKNRARRRSRTWTQPSSGLRPQAKIICPRATGTGEGSDGEKNKNRARRRSRTWTQPSSGLRPQAKIVCPRATGTGEGSDWEKRKGEGVKETKQNPDATQLRPGRNPAPACDLKRKFFVQGPQALAREAIGKREKERARRRSRTRTQPSSGLDTTQLRPATSSENSLSKGHRHWRGKR